MHSASRSGVASPPAPGPGRRLALLLAALLSAVPARAREPICNALSSLGSAAEAARRGDPAGGARAARDAWATLPRGPLGAQSAAALGLALVEAGRPAEALEPLLAALTLPPAGVEPRLRLALGRALLAAGRPAEALAPLAELSRLAAVPSPPGAAWLEAEALLSSGRVAAASSRLEALLAGAGDDARSRRGRLLLAQARRLAGRAGEALALYRALALEEPDRPEGAEAATALQRWSQVGEVAAELTGGDRLRRAERLLQRGRPAEALAEADLAAGTLPPAPPAPTALVQALALAGLGRFAEAAELALPLERSEDPGLRRGGQWVLARAAARAGQTEEASRRYAAVAAGTALVAPVGERRSLELGDEAAYLSAWLWYEAGDWRRAVTRLDAYARSHPASPRAGDAGWFAAWSSVRAGDLRGAQARLARLEAGPLADAALYWQGRLGGGSARARDRLRRAALVGGDGWYGWLARRRLERLGASAPPWPPAADSPAGAAEEAHGPGLAAAAALFGLGQRAEGLEALEAAVPRGSAGALASEACRLATFAGEPAFAFRTARDLLGQTRASQRWLYPDAFQPGVSEAAGAAAVDEALLLAVLRRESAFRPEARSAAGAVGLGQLLPRTADRLGLLAAPSTPAASRLDDPATNLPLAALYLGLLRDRFGSDAGALAAYNAGPGPPATWIRPGAAQPLDEWVENVPYKETRLYLKTVLASREVYRRLAGLGPALDPTTPVPPPRPGVAF